MRGSPVAGGTGLVYPKKECGTGQAAPPCSSGSGRFEFLRPSALGLHVAPQSWRSHRHKGICDSFNVCFSDWMAKHCPNTARTKNNSIISCLLYHNWPIFYLFPLGCAFCLRKRVNENPWDFLLGSAFRSPGGGEMGILSSLSL